MTSDWKTAAAAKRDSILSSIPEKWHLAKIPSVEEQKDVTGSYIQQFLSPQEVEITETDAVGIANKVASGDWSAVAVAEAFCHRAALAHQLVNCLHETFFEAAVRDARSLDEFFAKNKKTVGPLHGVPVSLKDQFHVKDVETTMGYTGWIGTFEGKKGDPRAKVFESEMVRELRELGAILYCKTSVPHSLMTGETVNNIIQYTYNPKNRHLSSGGSSGGEGALIGLRGSPLGFGTDIGGSIRIPAAFNGLYGIRPSSGRLPYEGMANSMDGQNSVLSVVGPLGTTLGAIRLAIKSLLSQSPWLFDPQVVDMPWRSHEEQAVLDSISGKAERKLTFAVLKSDGVITPHPPVARAVDTVVNALEKAGHKVIEWKPPAYEDGLQITFNTWLFDGGNDIHSAIALSGENLAPQVSMSYGTEPQAEATGSQIAANNVAQRQWKKATLDYWNSTASATGTGQPVDAVIAPLAPFAAARPTRYIYYGYSVFVNGLDYTSVVVPVTLADKTIDKPYSSFKPISDKDKEIQDDYDPEMYDGSYVSVQLVGRRFTEEKMLTIAEYVGGIL